MKSTRYSSKPLLLVLLLVLMVSLSGCFWNNEEDTGATGFKWWITDTDAKGTFYTKYEENPVIQWINNQYWDSETGSYTDGSSGEKLNLTFMNALKGSESDNFNTMIATGSYPEIIDLAFSNDSPQSLFDEGIILEITDYVEQYMPNYIEFIENNPELKPFLVHTDETGDDHYYHIQSLADSPIDQFQGYEYRRDWVVKYAEPTPYIWDLDSAYVTENGHPLYTPLSEAIINNDYTGWKTNPVTSFTSNFGGENDWEDNVIFPSGTNVPLYISDWEWMFDAFSEAIETEGFGNDVNSYPTTLYYLGYNQTGDLVSSFGGGGPMWYVDDNGNAAFGATGNNFKTYLEAMHNWYSNGWIDTRFETRAADMFFKINLTGISQGKVGLWKGSKAFLGDTIRVTASDPEAQNDAMVFGASHPINDVYGDSSNKFKEPDTFYGGSTLAHESIAITEKASDKDLATLFTLFNWMYSFEGGLSLVVGLSEEQYSSMTFSPDLYAEYDITAGFTVHEENGKTIYRNTVPSGTDLSSAIRANRLSCKFLPYGSDVYEHDRGYSIVDNDGVNIQWKRYANTGYILNYNPLLDDEASGLLAKTDTYVNDLMGVAIPALIKDGMGGWDTFVTKVNKYGPGRVTNVYQELFDELYN